MFLIRFNSIDNFALAVLILNLLFKHLTLIIQNVLMVYIGS